MTMKLNLNKFNTGLLRNTVDIFLLNKIYLSLSLLFIALCDRSFYIPFEIVIFHYNFTDCKITVK